MWRYLCTSGFKTVVVEDAARGIAAESIAAEQANWAEIGIDTVTSAELLGTKAGKRALIMIDVQVRMVCH